MEERSEVINNKKRLGDWEIDTIIGKDQKGVIVTITQRATNFFIAKKPDKGKDSEALAKTVTAILTLYKSYVHSITSDNGTEFAGHEK